MSYKEDKIPELEAYLKGYMVHLVERGYLKQFFNVEIWGLNKSDGGIDFCFCEINPRCAHAYHIPYQIAYGTNLWSDNFNLVLNNVMGCKGKRVDEILDYTLVDHWDFNGKVEL